MRASVLARQQVNLGKTFPPAVFRAGPSRLFQNGYISALVSSDPREEMTREKEFAPPLLSVAPMMDWTDVHFRQLARCDI